MQQLPWVGHVSTQALMQLSSERPSVRLYVRMHVRLSVIRWYYNVRRELL